MKKWLITLFLFALPFVLFSKTLMVPGEHGTIATAIEASNEGDTIMVAPGEYQENLKLENKTLTLASHYLNSQNSADIRNTIIDGNGETVLELNNVGYETTIMGFTIRNGDDGIFTTAKFNLLHNYIVKCKDGIDYEGHSGGLCQNNVFELNQDDAIDLDDFPDIIIENNILRNNEDDGIEIRLHEYDGPQITCIIRKNLISGNGEDGIQFIDYPDVSNRVFYVMNNIIAKTAMAAIGCMSDGNTKENYEAANIPELIYLLHNTMVDNHYGVTAGDNMVMMNNIIMNTTNIALKNVDGNSKVENNCLWKNGIDHIGSNVIEASMIYQDPLLEPDFRLKKGSPCIDTGCLHHLKSTDSILGEQIKIMQGKAPDLGALEFGSQHWDLQQLPAL